MFDDEISYIYSLIVLFMLFTGIILASLGLYNEIRYSYFEKTSTNEISLDNLKVRLNRDSWHTDLDIANGFAVNRHNGDIGLVYYFVYKEDSKKSVLKTSFLFSNDSTLFLYSDSNLYLYKIHSQQKVTDIENTKELSDFLRSRGFIDVPKNIDDYDLDTVLKFEEYRDLLDKRWIKVTATNEYPYEVLKYIRQEEDIVYIVNVSDSNNLIEGIYLD